MDSVMKVSLCLPDIAGAPTKDHLHTIALPSVRAGHSGDEVRSLAEQIVMRHHKRESTQTPSTAVSNA